jgi:porin
MVRIRRAHGEYLWLRARLDMYGLGRRASHNDTHVGCYRLAADLSSPVNASAKPLPWLLGDWDGARTQMIKGGVDFQLSYVGEVAGNSSGGVRRQAAYADQWAAGVTIDLGRLAVLQGGSIQVTVTDRNGTNLSNDAGLGTLEEVEEIYGRGQTARLTRFYYNQIFADGLVEWKIGRIPFSEDFAAFACDFQNLTFCGAAAGNIVSNYVYNWPISQWASRWKLALTDSGYFQFAVFDQNPKYLGLPQAVLPAYFAGSTGVLLPAEFAWLPKLGGLDGSYKFGGWFDTSLAPDVVSARGGSPVTVAGSALLQGRGRYGAYVNFLQKVRRYAAFSGGLSLFFNATIADRRTAFIDAQLAGGLVYTGPFRVPPRGRFWVRYRGDACEQPGSLVGNAAKSSGAVRSRGPEQRIRC